MYSKNSALISEIYFRFRSMDLILEKLFLIPFAFPVRVCRECFVVHKAV